MGCVKCLGIDVCSGWGNLWFRITCPAGVFHCCDPFGAVEERAESASPSAAVLCGDGTRGPEALDGSREDTDFMAAVRVC